MKGGKYANTEHSPFLMKLGIRQTDQSFHHEVWVHLDSVERRGS